MFTLKLTSRMLLISLVWLSMAATKGSDLVKVWSSFTVYFCISELVLGGVTLIILQSLASGGSSEM